MDARECFLAHHGILGQKWGHRNGPPYPLGDSDHSAAEKKAGWRKSLAAGRPSIKDRIKNTFSKYNPDTAVKELNDYYKFDDYKEELNKLKKDHDAVENEYKKYSDEMEKLGPDNPKYQKYLGEALSTTPDTTVNKELYERAIREIKQLKSEGIPANYSEYHTEATWEYIYDKHHDFVERNRKDTEAYYDGTKKIADKLVESKGKAPFFSKYQRYLAEQYGNKNAENVKAFNTKEELVNYLRGTLMQYMEEGNDKRVPPNLKRM